MLSDKFLGVEADVEHTPQFFGPGIQRTVSTSGVTTLTGNLVCRGAESHHPGIAAPLPRLGRRPHPRAREDAGRRAGHDQQPARARHRRRRDWIHLAARGARFELRHFKNLTNDSNAVTIGGTRLSFWRLTAGLVFDTDELTNLRIAELD